MPETPFDPLRKRPRALARFLRWRGWVPLLLLLLLGVALLAARYVFNPSVQREFVLRKAAPWVDSLAVEYLRLTPWSLVVRGADIVYQGARYHIGTLEVGFNPIALLDDTVSIKRLYLQHTDIDLRELVSPPPTDEPFSGLLPTLDHGFALALEDVDAAASVMLKGQHGVTVRLAGGRLKPHVAGSLNISLAYVAPSGPDRIDAVGTLTLSQLSHGRIRALSTILTTDFTLAALPAPEQVQFSFKIAPPPGLAGNPYVKRFSTHADGTQRAVPNPEAITFEAVLGDREVADRARFTIDGLYRGEDGVFSAGYRLLAATSVLAPYVGDLPLPEITSETRGAFQVETLHGAGQMTMETETVLSALERVVGAQHTLPPRVVLRGTGNGTFNQARVELAAFQLTLADDAPGARFAARLTAPLEVPFAAPLKLLAAPRTLAELHVGPLPLSWLDGFVPDYQFTGELMGSYALVVDAQGRVKLNSVTPTTLQEIRIQRNTEVLAEHLDLSVQPTASWSTDYLRCAFNDLEVTAASKLLAKLNIKIASKHEPLREWRYRVAGQLDVDTLRSIPVVAAQLEPYTLPHQLRVNFKSLVGQRAETVSIEKLDVTLGAPAHADLLTVNGLQTFRVQLGADGIKFQNPRGDLAHASLKGFDLEWLNPFLSELNVEGRVAEAAMTLSAPTAKTLGVKASAPMVVQGLSLKRAGKPLLRGLEIVTTPNLGYGADSLALALSETTLRARGQALVRGDANIALRELGTPSPGFTLSGALRVDINALAKQPVIAAALPQALPAVPINGTLAFALEGTPQAFTISKAQADFKLGERAALTMQAEPGLAVKTVLAAGANLAQHVVGALALDIKDLPSSIVGQFVALGNISFAEINSSLRLRSNGEVLRATSLAPLAVDDVRITDGTHVLFNPFNLQTTASLRIEQQRVRGTFETTALTFTGLAGRAALAGDIKAEIEPGRQVPLTSLEATLTADLTQLLAQPAVMSGHRLTGGSLSFKAKVDADRHLEATLLLDQLEAREPLAIQTFELPMTGEIAADGRGFDFTAPLVGRGKSGLTNATVVGHYAPQPDEPRVLRLDIKSDVFYLNDILASLAAISPQRVASVGGRTKKVKIALNEIPDEKAAWKLIPYAVVIDLNIDKLFYSDYLAFNEVSGQLDLRRRKLALSGIKANFHDSAITFDGVTRFTAGTPDPYDLQIAGKVADFNLSEFFTALVPNERSRVEGLFGVDFKAFGQFPNLSQLRNRVLFDIKMQSREGLFRPLPPDSALTLGASGVLGLVGEGLSYIPTGGFGAGAVARLVNYIAEIDYDTIDIHLVRDASRNVNVEQFLVLSPTIALTATGGILYAAGHDILDSPLELNANLDMLGRGAAILYSMDLMQDAQNAFGYWRGPEFRIWGTVEEPLSNFEDIVKKAGEGTLRGSITRPISGLIGNLKYRWFNDNRKAKEAAREQRRAAQEKAAAAAVAAPSNMPAAE